MNLLLILLGLVVLFGFSIYYYRINYKQIELTKHNTKKPQKFPSIGGNFKWETQEPRSIRPFLGKKSHKISMAISDLSKSPEDWLLIEKTYKDTTSRKKNVTENYPQHTVHCDENNPRAALAVKEYYDKVMNYYVQRYPMYFVVTEKGVFNKIHNELLPFSRDQEPQELIKILAANTEEDFVLLLKDDTKNLEEEYKLRASLTGAPSGFDPAEGFNQPISVIHGPVPSYVGRLKFSMHKFFNRLTCDDLWERHNWSIQTHPDTFALTALHAYGEDIKALKYDEIDFENSSFLRVERQILTRLPESGAIMMSVHTYLTPLSIIKQEGLGEELIRAIDGLPEDLAYYKRRAAWGPAVKQYLKS